jgi:hypothetical protein
MNDELVDETEEHIAMILIVANRRRQRLGWQECGSYGLEPAFEVVGDGANVSLSVPHGVGCGQVRYAVPSASP